jgi:hypothetical protein
MLKLYSPESAFCSSFKKIYSFVFGSSSGPAAYNGTYGTYSAAELFDILIAGSNIFKRVNIFSPSISS